MGFSAGWRSCRSRRAANKLHPRNASEKPNVVGRAAALTLIAWAAPVPASAQYFPPVMIIVPPAQNYAAPKPAPNPAPDKQKPDDAPSPDGPKGHYQGRTFIPDK
jgi:hypothetical protein